MTAGRRFVLTGAVLGVGHAHSSEGLLAAPDRAPYIQLHGQVPPGDGGIALGQAVVPDAIASGR